MVRPSVINKLFFALIALSFLGCFSSNDSLCEENDERLYLQAKEFQSQGRHEDALISYIGLISIRSESPESHLEVGYIYLNTLKDPIRSIYHFDRYLELKPESRQAVQVRQLIETAKKAFVRQLPTNPFESDLDRIDLLDIIKKLKKENEILKVKYNKVLGHLRESGDKGSDVAFDQVKEHSFTLPTPGENIIPRNINPGSVPRTYQVKSGDTLSKISEKFYGTESRWNDIYQANRDRLTNAGALSVSQEIIIP